MRDDVQPATAAAGAAAAPASLPEPPKVRRARLAADGTYLGETNDPAATGPDAPDASIIPGKYRWDGDLQSWVPLLNKFKRNVVSGKEMDNLVAMALGLRAYRDGKPLPAYTLAWLDQFDRYADDLKVT